MLDNNTDFIGEFVGGYIDDKDLERIKQYIIDNHDEEFGEDEFVENFEDIMDALKIDWRDFYVEYIDGAVMMYADAIDIVNESNYWSGWTQLAADFGGKIDNISQLAYMILDADFYESDGPAQLAAEVWNSIDL